MSKFQETPRSIAASMLYGVIGEGKLLSELTVSKSFLALSPPDRARSQRLALETLRGLERADRLLSNFIQKKPPLEVQNILRLSVVEICSGGQAHGVVNEAVNLVGREKKFNQFKGLVNAVLRKVAQKGPHQWANLRASRMPKWLRIPLSKAYGNSTVSEIEKVQFKNPPVDLTLKHPEHANHVAKNLGGQVILGQSVRLANAGQISKLTGFQTGDWWIQDTAAAIPIRLLKDLRGKTALDLCAAPGGKTLQLSAAGAQVNAIDISRRRLKFLEENLNRTGLVAHFDTVDAFEITTQQYDVVVLDAPCSATGTIRRHPDLPYAKDGTEFGRLIDMQERLLKHALTFLAPEGRLVYCTCSLLPDEGEAQIETVLKQNNDYEVDPEMFSFEYVQKDWFTENIGLRLRPDYLGSEGGMDGFFASVLRRKV